MTSVLLDKGATINAFDKKDRRAIHWAAYMGHVEVVKILVDHGAELNCRDKMVGSGSMAALVGRNDAYYVIIQETAPRAHCTLGIKVSVFEQCVSSNARFCCSAQCVGFVVLRGSFIPLSPSVRNIKHVEES